MQIDIHTDETLARREALSSRVEQRFAAALAPYAERLGGVEVHLTDECDRATGNDMSCVVRVSLDGQPPVAATGHASTIEEAVGGAAHQLDRLLASRIGRGPRGSIRQRALSS
ncbi:MAG: hypothetical protein ABI112_18025 [Terracoccus sp.]